VEDMKEKLTIRFLATLDCKQHDTMPKN